MSRATGYSIEEVGRGRDQQAVVQLKRTAHQVLCGGHVNRRGYYSA